MRVGTTLLSICAAVRVATAQPEGPLDSLLVTWQAREMLAHAGDPKVVSWIPLDTTLSRTRLKTLGTDLPVFQVIDEVNVCRSEHLVVGNLRQGKIVRGDQADAAAIQEGADNGVGPDTAVVGVGAVQDLVQQEEQRRRALPVLLRQRHQQSQP